MNLVHWTGIAALLLGAVCASGQEAAVFWNAGGGRWEFKGTDAKFLGSDAGEAPRVAVRKTLFTDQLAAIQFQTDADECSVDTSGGGTFSFRTEPGKVNLLVLDARAGKQAFRLNGQEMRDTHAQWVRGFDTNQESFLLLKFPGAKVVNLRLTRQFKEREPRAPVASDEPSRAAPARRVTAPLAPSVPGPATAPSIPRPTDVLSTTRLPSSISSSLKAVFALRITDGAGRTVDAGSGLLISDDGFALTNHHVLDGAVSAVAVADAKPAPIQMPVELWKLDPQADLALIRLGSAEAMKAGALEPLRLGGVDMSNYFSYSAYAAGSMPGRGRVAAPGQVRQHDKAYENLPDELRLTLPQRDGAVWVVTDCPIPPQLSGGPLLNFRGEVVGLNTWGPLRPNGQSFAVAAADLVEFVKRRPTSPTAFKDAWEPRPFAAANIQEPPTLDVEAKLPPAQLTRLLSAFERAANCNVCGGRGLAAKTITSYRRKGNVKVPVRSTVDRDCERCGGTGLGRVQAIDASLTRLVDAVASLDLEGRGADEAALAFEQTVTDLGRKAGRDKALTTRNVDRLFTSGAGGEARSEPEGAPVAAIGRLFEAHDDAGGRWTLVSLGGDRYLAVADPKIGGTYVLGRACVGGLYSGMLRVTPNLRLPMIRGGFIISLEGPGSAEP